MVRRRFFYSLLSVVILLALAPVRLAYAAPNYGDEVVLGDDFTLHEGEHVSGDLVIIGGDLSTLTGSRVEGSITALGGRAKVDGTVEGDLVALGGDVILGTHARIAGNVVAIGGHIEQHEGARTGDIVRGPTIRNIRFWKGLRLPFFSLGTSARPNSVVWFGVITLMGALLMAALGLAISTFWPTQTSQVADTIVASPLPSVGVGCLIYPLAVTLTVFVLITICLAPFAPVVVLFVVAASLFGWVALGTLFGRWLARWTGWRGATQLAVTGTGVFALTIVAAVMGSLPCLGPIVTFAAVSIGAGAVTLSRFGTARPESRLADSAAES